MLENVLEFSGLLQGREIETQGHTLLRCVLHSLTYGSGLFTIIKLFFDDLLIVLVLGLTQVHIGLEDLQVSDIISHFALFVQYPI